MPSTTSSEPGLQIEFIQSALRDWHNLHGRKSLPWQIDPTPYRVWVSEIMLQQTQVQTVIPYFEKWMGRFGSIQDLADAHIDEVMALWQGLGYYRRARHLHQGAQYLVQEYDGLFPKTIEGLRSIPGIGPYTAGAIMAFAYDQPAAIVDGNIKRLFCRLFSIHGHPSITAVNQQIWDFAEALTPKTHNRTHAQALLDLGATVCTPKHPQCSSCPLNSVCVALMHDRVAQLPTPKAKRKKPQKSKYFLWAYEDQRILLEKRQASVWQDLWCLPEIEPPSLPDSHSVVGEFQHQFTHYQLNATVLKLCAKENECGHHWVDLNRINNIGLPTPIRRFIEAQLP